MKYGATTITHFARDAGFVSADVAPAVAIALAASHGIPHYDISAGVPGAGRWVGLWGINVDEWTDYLADELHDPTRAATAAHELTVRVGGFGWSAHWRAGADRAWRDVAVAGSVGAPFQEQERNPIIGNLYYADMARTRQRLMQPHPEVR